MPRFKVRYPSVVERFLYALITLFFACLACCGLGGCARPKPEGPVVTTWAMICVRNDQPTVRTSDESCLNAPERFHWLYVFQNEPTYRGCPAVGQQLADKQPDDGWITTTERPPGQDVIGIVPFNGGLGVALPGTT